jgi:hypothetical protein
VAVGANARKRIRAFPPGQVETPSHRLQE